MKLEKLFENGLLYTPYNNGGSPELLSLCRQKIGLILRRLEIKNKHIIFRKKDLYELMCYFEDTKIFKCYTHMFTYSRLKEMYMNLDIYGIKKSNMTDSYSAPMKKDVYKLIDFISEYITDSELTNSDKKKILELQVYTCEAMTELSTVLDMLCWIDNILKYLTT